MNHFELIMGAMASIVAVLIGMSLFMKWIYSQGNSAARLAGAMDANTAATVALSCTLAKFSEKTDTSLKDLDHRVVKTEAAVLFLMPSFRKGETEDRY